MPKSIFLCHSATDKEFARTLTGDLRARGVHVWLDEAELKVGDSLIGRIEGAIDDVDYLAVVLSPASVGSKWVLTEVRMALHREIAGRSVVVLPLLRADCELPGFLRDKLYIDFRNSHDYQRGVLQVLDRVFGDLHQQMDPELAELVGELPFSRLLKQAVATSTYSTRLLAITTETLAAMEGGADSWNPAFAASFCLFVIEVLRQKTIPRQAWLFLCGIIEDISINDGLRYWTLDRIALAWAILPSARDWPLPCVFDDTSDRDLFTMCLEAFFDPSTYNFVTTDRHTPVRVLAYIWANGGPEYRSRAQQRIDEHMRQHLPGSEGLLARFVDSSANADVGETESLLVDFRKAWVQSSPDGSVVRDRRLVEETLQGLLADDTGAALDNLMELFHGEYSRKQEDKYDFELFMTLGRVLTPPFMKVLRERRGVHALYDLLVTLITDQRVDLEFSVLALITVTEEFGAEGLMLDDRIPRGIFELRGSGPEPTSLAGVLVETIISAEQGDSTAALLTIALHSALDLEEKARLRAVLDRRRGESERIKVLTDFLDGKITARKAEQRFRKL